MRYVYLCLVLLRFLLIFTYGMIHCDEYFQSYEIIVKEIFQFGTFIPWEFLPTAPNRSVLFPYVILGLPFRMLQIVTNFFGMEIHGRLLLYLPRIVLFFVSLLHDATIYRICQLWKYNSLGYMTIFASSWVTLLFLTRTFSNVLESLVYIVALRLAIETVHKKSTAQVYTRKFRYLGLLCGVGVFIRFTFLIFVFPIGGYLLYHNIVAYREEEEKKGKYQGRFSCFQQVTKSIAAGAIGFLIACMICMMIDTVYFRGTNALMKFDQIVISPLNNLLYNMEYENVKLHGVHPRITHSLINMPLLFNVVYFAGFYRVYQCIKYGWNEKTVFFVVCISFPLLILSLSPHQEPRFLLPLQLPLLLFVGSSLLTSRKSRSLILVLCFCTVIPILFYGFLHQAGVIPSLLSLQSQSQEGNNRFIFYKTYMPPGFLLYNSTEIHSAEIIDMGGEDLHKVTSILFRETNSTTFFITPGSVTLPPSTKSRLLIKHSIFPHLSTEDLPSDFSALSWSLVVYQVL